MWEVQFPKHPHQSKAIKAPSGVQFETDQLNLILMPDNYLTDATERLAPHLWALSLDEPHKLSGNLELQGPVIDTVTNWLYGTS